MEGQFPMEIWSQIINGNITERTANGTEKFHQGFNSELYTSNSSVFMVIDITRNIIHTHTAICINQYLKEVQNIDRLIEKQKLVSKYTRPHGRPKGPLPLL
jgi:hypothetical protein